MAKLSGTHPEVTFESGSVHTNHTMPTWEAIPCTLLPVPGSKSFEVIIFSQAKITPSEQRSPMAVLEVSVMNKRVNIPTRIDSFVSVFDLKQPSDRGEGGRRKIVLIH